MFELRFCAAQPAVSTGNRFSPIICFRHSAMDCIDMLNMYFFCVVICLFVGFILTAIVQIMTMYILKYIFYVTRTLSVPVSAVCINRPVKSHNIGVIFIYLFRRGQNVVLHSVDLFPLALYLSLVNFVHSVVLFVLFLRVTSACVDGGLLCNM